MTEPNLTAPAAGPVTADPAKRILSGRIVPFGPAGYTKAGLMTFAAGGIKLPSDPSRIKLLLEHDQTKPVGVCTGIEERPDGLWATFAVPEGEAGDRALADAERGLRDSFSVGTQLDDATAERLRVNATTGASTAAEGTLREVSLVSVPAFPEAQVSVAAAIGDLTITSWSATPPPTAHPRSQPVTVTDTAATPAAGSTAPAPAAPATAPVPATAATTPDVATATPAPATAPVPVTASAPLAHAGAALVTSEPATYRFDGTGPSLVRDLVGASQGDHAAAGRVERFNAEVLNRNTSTELAMAAVLLRDPVPDSMVPNQATKSPISVALSTRRPLVDRTTPVQITNAQPFYVPVIGDFAGVGTHTEGTPHVTEGTLTLGDGLVTPVAISGAYRMSRELVDSSSPALDSIALNAMVAEYGRAGEARVAAALEAGKGSTATGVDTVAELRDVLIGILGATDDQAEAAVLSAGLYAALAADEDTTGRPFLSYAPAVNSPAQGVISGNTGANVDGTPLSLASKLAADTGFVYSKDSIIYAETPAQQFRLDQPEGPGIIKIAIFGYSAAKVVNSAKVKKLTKA